MSEFLLGCSTAAHQVEGNNIHSDYWAEENMTHTDFNEKSGIACDHYNRYKEDIDLMKKAGFNAYRFSVEWARIEPEEGQFDDNAIQHYQDVIDYCRTNGIEPIVTLLHFTSPKWLICKGGWENPDVVSYFAIYVRKVISSLGKNLNYVCTINEANMGIQIASIAKRYKQQMMANLNPFRKLFAKKDTKIEGQAQVGMNFKQMMANMKAKQEERVQVFGVSNPQVFVSQRTPEGDLLVCKAHQKAREVIKELYPNIKVGITLSLHDIQVVGKGEKNALKEWDEEFTHYLPYLKDDDFFGLQNYSRSLIGPKGLLPNPKDSKVTQMGYENYPEGLEHVIRKVYGQLSIPILITENGIATDNDEERCEFITKAMQGVENCRKDNIPVIGYMHWSYCDNFEWQKGFSMKFGLVSVDRETMERKPKNSFYLLGSYKEKTAL